MQALYTDGTPVRAGDRVRYHQAPGGLMAPPTNLDGSVRWHYGVAAIYPYPQDYLDAAAEGRLMLDVHELHLLTDDGRYYHMAPHVIERAEVSA